MLDAGDPVKGAKVKAGGKSGTTNRKGRVTLTLRTKATAKASKAGYAGASKRVRARR